MWCPRCQKKYDDEFETCLVCGGALEDYTPILAADEKDILDLGEERPDDSPDLEEQAPPEDLMPELLVSVAGEDEARRLAALLESLKIPCLCRKSEDAPLEELEEEAVEEYEDDYDDDLDQDFVDDTLPDDVEIFDLLVPQMLIRKALRVLHEDEALQAEREAAQAEIVEEDATESKEQEAVLTEEKPKKKFFGLFGKK